MKPARLLRLIGDVDPQLVDITPIEDCIPQKRPNKWIRWVSLAACAALVVCGIGRYVYLYIDQQSILYPMDSMRYEDNMMHPYSIHLSIDEPYTFYSMAAESDVIVVADIVEVEEGTRLLFNENYAHASIREVLKGDLTKKDRLCVADTATGEYSSAEGVPRLQVGHRVLLFLVKSENERTSQSGEKTVIYRYMHEFPHLGRFFYDADGKYHEASTYADHFPFPHSKFTFSDYEPKTLEEIKGLIQKNT